MEVGNREQETGSREQETGSREQETGSRDISLFSFETRRSEVSQK